MPNKAPAIAIIAALGIPLFPLGARLYLSRSNTAGFTEPAPAPRGIQETPAAGGEGLSESGRIPDKTLPPIAAETLARVFRSPAGGAAGEQPPGERQTGGAPLPAAKPVPGEGKYSYLGSIRESDDREWLYIKEEASGRIISINTSPFSINEERCVVEIEGISYSIRRK
jgi:hypothetical protein